MLQKLFTFLILITFITGSSLISRDDRRIRYSKVTDGSEVSDNHEVFTPHFTLDNFEPVHGSTLTFEFSPTGVFTTYDLQSNAVPNEIWQDPLVPSNVHGAFMYSTEPNPWTTRAIAYIFSNDGGATWQNLGNVPAAGRAGFPSISGFENGSAVIGSHNTSNGTTARAKYNYDAGAGFGVFTEIDPGQIGGADGIWTRVVGVGNTKMVFVASVNATGGATGTNSATALTPTFSGWVNYDGANAEPYCLDKAPNGKIGLAYVGSTVGDAFYKYSTDDGLTWSTPTPVWTYNAGTDSLGVLRGISMVYGANNEPYVAFNVSLLDPAGGFFPGLPSDIRVWSPTVNGGVPKIVASSLDVPFFPNLGNVADAYLPLCRPSVGRSSTGGGIFVAFEATTGNIGEDSSVYYSSWLAYTLNSGSTWVEPQKMTPATPIRDWRFVSISHVNNMSGTGEVLLQMMIQDDSLAGTYVNGSPAGVGQGMGIRTTITTAINNISSEVPSNFNLSQNFPNPFNPTTSIRFDVVKTTNITLKVYNSNGQEVATLVNNETISPGTKEVTFSGADLGSGIYFYTLYAGDFKETKKMMLIK